MDLVVHSDCVRPDLQSLWSRENVVGCTLAVSSWPETMAGGSLPPALSAADTIDRGDNLGAPVTSVSVVPVTSSE